MKNKAKFEIGSKLKNIETGVTIELLRYGVQSGLRLSLTQRGGISKLKPNFNYLFGQDIATGKKVEGLSRKFELAEE